MPELNLHHIDQITSDVRLQEIGFSHLFHDLVDHVCCDVEYHMQQGMSFDEAYKAVKAKIGFRGLKKIQEDTLYVVDTKYRNMKKLMKIAGVTGTIMLGFAAIFKISHWPMAGALITLGALVLSFLFLPSALTVLWKETKNQKKLILFISAFIAGFTFIYGMLFKIQHWPGAGIMILIGLATASFLFLPSLVIHLFQDKEKKHKRTLYVVGALSIIFYIAGFWFKLMHWPLSTVLMLTGSLILMIFIFPWFTWIQWKNDTNVNAVFIFMVITPLLLMLPGAMINLNISRRYDEGFFKKIEKQDILNNILQKKNTGFLTLYKDSVSFSGLNSIHTSVVNLLGIIDKIESNMVVVAEEYGDPINPSLLDLSGKETYKNISYENIKAPLHEIPATLMLLPGCKARTILEKQVSEYKATLDNLTGVELSKKYDSLLNPSEYLPATEDAKYQLGLMPNLNSLTLFKSAVLITESQALKIASGKIK